MSLLKARSTGRTERNSKKQYIYNMKILLLLLLILIGSIIQGQTGNQKPGKKVSRYLNTAIDIIQKNALYKDSIDWDEVRPRIQALAAGMKKVKESYRLIDTLIAVLRQAGDNHSGFLPSATVIQLNNESFSDSSIKSELIDTHIGYIRIPLFYSRNLSAGNAFANQLQQQIKILDEQASIKGWIIDLRGNRGGNMHPMVKGLTPLLGRGLYGYAIGPNREVTMSTETGDAANIQLTENYQLKQPKPMIAILTDHKTASSAEFTAIAFKHLPNTRFFGQATGGFTSSNQSFSLPDGASIFLATSYMCDRNRNRYVSGLVPDVVTEVKQDVDTALEAAKAWIEKK